MGDAGGTGVAEGTGDVGPAVGPPAADDPVFGTPGEIVAGAGVAGGLVGGGDAGGVVVEGRADVGGPDVGGATGGASGAGWGGRRTTQPGRIRFGWANARPSAWRTPWLSVHSSGQRAPSPRLRAAMRHRLS